MRVAMRPSSAVLAALAACVVACGGKATAGARESVGIAECDEYLSKVQACATRDPRLQAMQLGYKAQRDAWKQMARGNTAAVKANCAEALDAFVKSAPECR
ncbi:MAG TPA: hypothetical protein VKU41_24070 [Polyangiaceae bacterium]|nr:hypothetical protein [Polyangiaceae bacterium]